MKLLEKLKNTFFEEEYVEVEENEKEVVARKVEPKKEIKREEKKVVTHVEEEALPEEKKVENYSDREILNRDSKVSYFEEEDFLELEVKVPKKVEEKKIYGGQAADLYSSIDYSSNNGNKPYSAPLKESFKPTPIISPIYGVLDKNYKKEEVIDKKDKPSSYVSRRNADLDSIRRKAYGDYSTFEDVSIVDTNEEIVEENENGLLYDMTADNSKPVVDQVTLADAEEYFQDLGLEYNIDYKDNRYEKATGRRTISSNQELSLKEIETNEDANLEDNLFDLIDSMYEEGEE